MDELVGVIVQLAFHWRVALSLLIGFGAAFILVFTIPIFTGGYGVILVILAFGAGLLWEIASSADRVR